MAGLVLLAGCSFFSHRVTWTKSGATEDQAQSDLAQCQEVAETQTGVDQRIDQDIAAANTTAGNIDTTTFDSMQAFHNERRFKSVLEDCMAQLGYSKVE
ncbi:MAG TPA: hypothetical protein VMT54_07565 [Candidatus Cybelea sp.]|nr:hypothetical protein [Candidatus Cybelea sp.]